LLGNDGVVQSERSRVALYCGAPVTRTENGTCVPEDFIPPCELYGALPHEIRTRDWHLGVGKEVTAQSRQDELHCLDIQGAKAKQDELLPNMRDLRP